MEIKTVDIGRGKLDIIYNEDCLEGMSKLPDESINLFATDPPYGISFMGKQWDKALPSIDIWKEALRVLKPGAFAFVMCIPRQDCLARMIISLEDAGFNVSFSSIYWAYASGFPKSQNIGKVVDKRLGAERKVIGENIHSADRSGKYEGWGTGDEGKRYDTEPSTFQAQALDGSYGGFQPKPAIEVVIVAMKPLSEKTYVDQALANRHGISWLDEGRIPYKSEKEKEQHIQGANSNRKARLGIFQQSKQLIPDKVNIQSGRFPANLLVSDDVLNDGRVSKSLAGRPNKDESHTNTYGWAKGGIYKSGEHYPDSGSFSRYFSLDSWWDKKLKELPEGVRWTFPFLIVPKASRAEKEKGLENFKEQKCRGDYKDSSQFGLLEKIQNSPRPTAKNFHPTVKPLKLMSYLITLGSREGDIILDPFIGSGTTAIAAVMMGRHYIGYETDREYVKIAKTRVEAEKTLWIKRKR